MSNSPSSDTSPPSTASLRRADAKNTAVAVVILACLGLACPASGATIDMQSLDLFGDPPNGQMTGTVDGPNQVTFVASPPPTIPAGTDIAAKTVDGNTVATSTTGLYFSRNSDFTAAIDFSFSDVDSVGFGAIGFGVGVEGSGENTAGIVQGILNGSPFGLGGAARANDLTQTPLAFSAFGGLTSGRFFIDYEASTGTVQVGASATPGATMPDASLSGDFTGIQDAWALAGADEDLLVSFFLRSDSLGLFAPLSAGELTAVFSSFEVLDGEALSLQSMAVPEPSTAVMLLSLVASASSCSRPRRRRMKRQQPAAA